MKKNIQKSINRLIINRNGKEKERLIFKEKINKSKRKKEKNFSEEMTIDFIESLNNEIYNYKRKEKKVKFSETESDEFIDYFLKKNDFENITIANDNDKKKLFCKFIKNKYYKV